MMRTSRSSRQRLQKKKGTEMVPPKLNLVPQRPEPEEAREDIDGTEPAADASEVLAHEGWRGLPANVGRLPSADRRDQLRILEALLFAASEPLAEQYLRGHLGSEDDVAALLDELKGFYASRGINLVKVAGKWAFRTAEDLSYLLERHATEQRRLSKAAMETLAIIAYHQPVTRTEIEQVRGVGLSKGTLDLLFEQNWIRPMGRRRVPGRPVTWGTTDFFLEHFGLPSLEDLPGHEEMKAAGLLDPRAQPPIFRPDEPDLPLEAGEDEVDEPLAADEPTS
jgi:segregation and condensation protein B